MGERAAVLLVGGPMDGRVVETDEAGGPYLQMPHPDDLPSFDRPETLEQTTFRLLTYERTRRHVPAHVFGDGHTPVYRYTGGA